MGTVHTQATPHHSLSSRNISERLLVVAGEPLEGVRDGEQVCEWYKVKETPAFVFFTPNSQRPKYIDAPQTRTGITDWIEEQIAKEQAALGQDESTGLTEIGLELLNPTAVSTPQSCPHHNLISGMFLRHCLWALHVGGCRR